ncbi:MAG: 5-dehydro-2-deoxygluconokinase [Betaproteobacteria bacterium]
MIRTLDLICMGRAAVDLYGEQIGCRLEDVSTFAKYLGGSPANTAVGVSRLGLKSAMLSRVGDEQLGRFVREQLVHERVDVSQVSTDPKRLTGLVFLAVRDRDSFPHVFYRENCADMALSADHIDDAFIASATGLLVSGTLLSQETTRLACHRAVASAKAGGTRLILDIDYRPVLWGLTATEDGESRFVSSAAVTAQFAPLLADCALIVGTEEEIRIAGGDEDTLAALDNIRQKSAALIVLKRGADGCVAFPGAIPAALDAGIVSNGFPVEVFNVLGAGDAFMAGFLSGWLRAETIAQCCRYANACGAIVVSRHGCAPAMATAAELDYFLAHGSTTPRLRDDAQLSHVHRATTRRTRAPRLKILAFDHRSQLERVAEDNGAAHDRIAAFKALVAQAFLSVCEGRHDCGVLLDGRYGEDVLPLLAGRGLWIARPVETPGSIPVDFESGPNTGLALRTWPGDHIVKCLAFYHPDDADDLKLQQVTRIRGLAEACQETGHEFLLEIIPPERASDTYHVGSEVLRALTQLYDAGIRPDWWKLPPSADPAVWHALGKLIEARDPLCQGMLVLGMEADAGVLESSFVAAASEPRCRGFAVGRTIFADAAAAWFANRTSDADVIAQIARGYRELIDMWDRAERAACLSAPLARISPPRQIEKGLVS